VYQKSEDDTANPGYDIPQMQHIGSINPYTDMPYTSQRGLGLIPSRYHKSFGYPRYTPKGQKPVFSPHTAQSDLDIMKDYGLVSDTKFKVRPPALPTHSLQPTHPPAGVVRTPLLPHSTPPHHPPTVRPCYHHQATLPASGASGADPGVQRRRLRLGGAEAYQRDPGACGVVWREQDVPRRPDQRAGAALPGCALRGA
jgi:hypothetical protein